MKSQRVLVDLFDETALITGRVYLELGGEGMFFFHWGKSKGQESKSHRLLPFLSISKVSFF